MLSPQKPASDSAEMRKPRATGSDVFTAFKRDDGFIQAQKVRHPSSDDVANTTDVIVETISKLDVYIL